MVGMKKMNDVVIVRRVHVVAKNADGFEWRRGGPWTSGL
jgi:hypothetical protein